MHSKKYLGNLFDTWLDNRREGAQLQSLRFSPQFLTHQTSHNKHAIIQSA